MNVWPLVPQKQTSRSAFFLIVFFIFSFFFQLSYGKLIQFKHVSLEDGLSQSSVFCIIQDQKGFLWIGTEDGLNKYDGYNFTVFKPDPDNLNSLSYNWINTIYEDNTGLIWIGTNGGGLNKYDPRTETFYRYPVNMGAEDCIGCGFINAICRDSQGIVWIGTGGGGLYRLLENISPALESQSIEQFMHDANIPASLSSNTVHAILEDVSGEIWVGTDNGLDRFDANSGTFIHYRHNPQIPRSISHNTINTIYEDSSNLLWIGTQGGLNLLNKITGKFKHYLSKPGNPNSLSNDRINSILEDHSGYYWIGTDGGGLNRLDKASDSFIHFRHDDQDPYSLSNNQVHCLLEDHSGILWLGTSGKGLEKFNREEKYLHYQHIPDNPNSLSENSIHAICEDSQGFLWFGSAEKGLNRLDRKKGIYKHFRYDENNISSISSDAIRTILEDSSGIIWVGTKNGGLNKLNRDNHTFTRYHHDKKNHNGISSDAVYSIIEDREGVIWLATWGGGLNRFDREKETFSCYRRSKYDANSIGGDFVAIVYEAPSEPGVLWVGTHSGGLNRLDVQGKIFTRFQADLNDPDSISVNFVISIHEDASGTLWIGTHGGGLNKMIGRREGNIRFVHYTENNGLPNNSIYGILEDNAGNLWMSTNKGLSKFDPGNETFKNYNAKDGLQANEFNGGAYFKNRNGEMFFGGVNGVNAFFPGKLRDNPHIPPVVITGVKVNNKSMQIGGRSPLQESILFTEKIELSYRQNAFSFEFAALDYTTPENNRYAYKMEGFDKGWNVTEVTKRYAFYTNLDSGDYVFRVIASNNDGVWNEEGAKIFITILPPFWKTWWFTSILSGIALGLIIFFIRLRIQRIERRSKEEQLQLKKDMERQQLKKELEFKADFMAMLVHDLRGPLSAVMAFAQSLHGTPDPQRLKKISGIIQLSSKKMMNLINNMLDYSKFEAGKMTLEQEVCGLMKIIGDSVKIMSPLFEQKDIHIDFQIPEDMKNIRLNIDAEKIGQVLNNLLNNAVKYAPENGKVTVGILLVGKNMVEVWVEDNGPGIPFDKQQIIFDKYSQLDKKERNKGTGLGLAVSKLIVEAHGGAIGCRNARIGTGSVIYFRLPC